MFNSKMLNFNQNMNPNKLFFALFTFLFTLYLAIQTTNSASLSEIRERELKTNSDSSGTFIVDIFNGKVFKPGEDKPVGKIEPLASKMSQTRSPNYDQKAGFRSESQKLKQSRTRNVGTNNGCVVFYNTQKFCEAYTMPWAINGSARVCGSDLRPPPPMPSRYSTSRATVYSLLSIVSLTSNTLLIAAVVVSAGLQKPFYWLLAGFSSSCILLVASQGLTLIPPTLLRVETSWILGEFPCYLVYVLSIIATVSSTIFILLIAFERYVVGKTPPEAKEFVTLKRAQASIIANWVISLAYGCCWVLFIEFDTCVLRDGSLIDRCQMRQLDIGRAIMSVTEGFFLLALPLAAAVILLVQTTAPIVNQIQKNSALPPNQAMNNPTRGPVGGRVVSSGYLMNQRYAMPPNSVRGGSTSQRQKKSTKAMNDKPYNLIRLMLFVLISYIVLAAPRRLTELYISSSSARSQQYFTETIFYTLMYLNTALFPFLVLTMSANVRRAVRKLIRPQKTSGRLFTHEASAQSVARRAREMQTFNSRRTAGNLNPNEPNRRLTIGGQSNNGTNGSNTSVQQPPEISISFIHVSPSGQNLNRLSSAASISRTTSVNSSNRHSSSSTDSMQSYDPNTDDVFYSFAPPKFGVNGDNPTNSNPAGTRGSRNCITPVRIGASSLNTNYPIAYARSQSQPAGSAVNSSSNA